MAWWAPLATAAAGWVGNKIFGGGSSGGSSSKSKPEAPERMPYNEALSQAKDVLTPQYNRARERTLGDVDNNLINRGFYGQAPGDTMKAGVMTDMESDFQGQLAQYATNLQNQDFTQGYQAYRAAMDDYRYEDQKSGQFWTGVGNIAGNFLSGPGGAAIIGQLGDWFTNRGGGGYTGGSSGGAGGNYSAY